MIDSRASEEGDGQRKREDGRTRMDGGGQVRSIEVERGGGGIGTESTIRRAR